MSRAAIASEGGVGVEVPDAAAKWGLYDDENQFGFCSSLPLGLVCPDTGIAFDGALEDDA